MQNNSIKSILVLFIVTTGICLAQPNFVNNAANADMLLITHDDLRTPNWIPGMNGAWETTFLAIKNDQNIDVYCYDIADEIDKDGIKTWIENNCVDIDFIFIIGDAHRNPNMIIHLEGFDPDFPVWSESDAADGNFVPLYGEMVEVDTYTWGEIPIYNDNEYGSSFNNCVVSRLPADNRTEINAYMDKCTQYYSLNAPAWAKNIVLLENNKYYGPQQTDPSYFGYPFEKIYLENLNDDVTNTTYRYSDNCQIVDHYASRQNVIEGYFNAGKGLITGVGTGSFPNNYLEMISSVIGFDDFDNDGMYPFLVASCCDLGSFDYWDFNDDENEYTCVLEELLVRDNGGIIGAIAPVWWTLPFHTTTVAIEANKLVFKYSIFEFATLYKRTKSRSKHAWEDNKGIDVIDCYQLFGDPSLQLPYQPWGHGYWDEEVVLEQDLHIEDGDQLIIAPGTTVKLKSGVKIIVDSGGKLIAEGTQSEPISFEKYASSDWDCIKFSSSSACESSLKHCIIENATYGIYLTGNGSNIEHLVVDSCSFDNCYYGVYANNSYFDLINSTIENCDYRGIYLVSCGAGKVLFDSDTIRSNGTYGTIYDNGIALTSSSDPEIINCVINENTGGGIYCVSSTPDLSTYDTMEGTRPNSIYSNGIGHSTGDQDDSDGAEIYLCQNSFPAISTNNIYDVYNDANWGAFIYKSVTSSTYGKVSAKGNYWGSIGVDSTDFRWTSLSPPKYFTEVFTVQNDSSDFIDDLSNWESGIERWNAGDFLSAAELFRESIFDGETEALNSIHYLAGCVNMGAGTYYDLRDDLLEISTDIENRILCNKLQRFAANCLTETGQIRESADEFLSLARNASTVQDSILFMIDYYAVCEIGGFDLDHILPRNVPEKINDLLKLLNMQNTEGKDLIPENYVLYQAYPNPFNSTTRIRFGLPQNGYISLNVYDLRGRLVTKLLQKTMNAGYHTVLFNGKSYPSGMYFYRLEANSFKKTMRFTLIK